MCYICSMYMHLCGFQKKYVFMDCFSEVERGWGNGSGAMEGWHWYRKWAQNLALGLDYIN